MIRLFISLYLVIIIGIITINWGSEFIWQQLTQDSIQELKTVKYLAKNLSNVITTEKQFSLLNDSAVANHLLSINDIAWQEGQKAQLLNGEVVTLFDLQDAAYVYIYLTNLDKILQIGPIAYSESTSYLKTILVGISYFLLAILIALWTRPIWRDLNHLTIAVKAINNHQPIEKIKVKSRSPISSVVNTVHQMAARIQLLIQEQKQLVNAVSHELRTPLSRLRFSFALLNNIEEKQQKEIEQDIEEIEALVDEMLSYSRIEHVAQRQKNNVVNISELLINQVEKHQRSTHIALNQEISPLLNIYCNGELLERACQNLITNAIRYAKQQIIITAKIQHNQLMISVDDDGEGIPKEEWTTIFEPFHRIDQSRNKALGGYGLGLAIVKKAADWHQGQCFVSESSLSGVSFTLTIPLCL